MFLFKRFKQFGLFPEPKSLVWHCQPVSIGRKVNYIFLRKHWEFFPKLFFFLFLIAWLGCQKEEADPLAGGAGPKAIDGIYTGTLNWIKFNPVTGAELRGTDPAASMEAIFMGNDKVSFAINANTPLGGRSFSSTLVTAMESGSGASYMAEFILEFGDANLAVNGAFGFYNRTLISVRGDRATMAFYNYTKPNITLAETMMMDAVRN